jgi:hypothetical protein
MTSTTFQTPGGTAVTLAKSADVLSLTIDGEAKTFRTALVVTDSDAGDCLKVCFGPLNFGTLYTLPNAETKATVEAVLAA